MLAGGWTIHGDTLDTARVARARGTRSLGIAVALGLGACGDVDPSTTQGAAPSASASGNASRPAHLPTFLGSAREASMGLDWRGPGALFPGIHSSVKQLRLKRGDATALCRFSAGLDSVRCVDGKRSADLITHQTSSAWYGLGAREPGTPAELRDLLTGISYVGEERFRAEGSVDAEGNVRWLDNRAVLRFGPADAKQLVGDAPRRADDIEPDQSSLFGPWLITRGAEESGGRVPVTARFIHASGPRTLGDPVALGDVPAYDARRGFGCWDHGHIGVLLPGTAVMLGDDPSVPPRKWPSRVHAERSMDGRIDVLCTPDGFISSEARAEPREDNRPVTWRVEERCDTDGCVHQEVELPGRRWATAPLGASSIAVGVAAEGFVMRIGPFASLGATPNRLMLPFAELGLPNGEEASVDVFSNGERAVALVMVDKGPRFRGNPGGSAHWMVHALGIDRDGARTPIRLEP